MAKIVNKNKKRRRFNIKNFAILFFVFAAGCSLVSSLFLRSYNNSLSVRIQSIGGQISVIETENASHKVEIQTLSSRDRVRTIAEEGGLEMNQDNITTVMVGE